MPSVDPPSKHFVALGEAWVRSTQGLYSLCPKSKILPPLDLLTQGLEGDIKICMAEGLVEFAACSARYFPQNIFFDCRYLAGWLVLNSSDKGDPTGYLNQQFSLLCELFELFGNATTIRFRYVHDFLYGYDWSRWIQKHPEDAQRHPYSSEFLRIMIRRGHEIIQVIEEGDRVYPPLVGEAHRNRFAFNREPEKEKTLFYAMAEKNQIPLPAWVAGNTALLSLDYHALRKAWVAEQDSSGKNFSRATDVLSEKDPCR